jgi:hypothetical protein
VEVHIYCSQYPAVLVIVAVHFEWRLDSKSNVYDAPSLCVRSAAQLLSWSDGKAVNKWTFDNVTVRAFGSFSLAPMTLSSILGSNDAKSVFLRVSFSPKAHSGYVNYALLLPNVQS